MIVTDSTMKFPEAFGLAGLVLHVCTCQSCLTHIILSEEQLERQLISFYSLALSSLGTCLNSILSSQLYATISCSSPRQFLLPWPYLPFHTTVEWQKKLFSLITLTTIQNLKSKCLSDVSWKTKLFLCYVDRQRFIHRY